MLRVPTRPRRRAFSLLEVVIVIAIISTLVAVAMPRFNGSLQRYRLDMAARRVAADLGYARRCALARSESLTVSFDAASDVYTLAGVPGLERGSDSYVIDLNSDPYRCNILSVLFEEPADDGDDPAAVVFNGYGVPDSGGSVRLSTGSSIRTIVLVAETGEVEVQ